jgi:hypothetical protein
VLDRQYVFAAALQAPCCTNVLVSHPEESRRHFCRPAISVITGRMKMQCKRCGIRGSSDLAFIWYGKKVDGKMLWLCPDCVPEFESDQERDRFLKGKKRFGRGD